MSDGHPPLDNGPPVTSAAIESRRMNAKRDSVPPQRGSTKKARIDMCELHNTIVHHNIRSDKDLCYLAKIKMKEGKDLLQRYILCHSNVKHRNDFINSVWSIEESTNHAEREKKSLMDILRECLNKECSVRDDDGLVYQWYRPNEFCSSDTNCSNTWSWKGAESYDHWTD